MLNEVNSLGRREDGGRIDLAADMAVGLQLMRAATMQAVRLQLALLRNEPRPAMESLDRLVAMDREIEHFIEGIGIAGLTSAERGAVERRIDQQKQALATEKLILTAGLSGPRLRPEPPPPEPAVEAEIAVIAVEPSNYRPGIAGKLFAGLILAGLSVAAAAWMFADRIALPF